MSGDIPAPNTFLGCGVYLLALAGASVVLPIANAIASPFNAVKETFKNISHARNAAQLSSDEAIKLLASKGQAPLPNDEYSARYEFARYSILQQKQFYEDNKHKIFTLPDNIAIILHTTIDEKDIGKIKLRVVCAASKSRRDEFAKFFPVFTKTDFKNEVDDESSKFRFTYIAIINLKPCHKKIRNLAVLVDIAPDAPDCHATIGLLPITHVAKANSKEEAEELLMKEKEKLTMSEESEDDDAAAFYNSATPDDMFLVKYSTNLIKPCRTYLMCKLVPNSDWHEKYAGYSYVPCRTGFVDSLADIGSKYGYNEEQKYIKAMLSLTCSSFRLLCLQNEVKSTDT